MADLLQSRWHEASKCLIQEFYFLASLLHITIIEGFLNVLLFQIGDLNESETKEPGKDGDNFKGLIDKAYDLGWLNPHLTSMTQGLREFRNCIHPSLELNFRPKYSAENSMAILTQVTQILDELGKVIGSVRINRDFRIQMPDEFLGRGPDLPRLYRLVSTGARFISILGPPGVGKTVLVEYGLQNNNELKKSRIRSISLSSTSTKNELRRTIESLMAEPNKNRKAPFVIALHDGEILGDVLAETVSEMLSLYSRLRFFYTATKRLGLNGEVSMSIGGLSFAPEGHNPDPPPLILLEQTIRKHEPNWRIPESGRMDYLHVCQLADGSPLAIQLFASDLKRSSVKSYVKQLLSGSSNKRLDDAFCTSFSLLKEEDQHVLKVIATFTGNVPLEWIHKVLAQTKNNISNSTVEKVVESSWVQNTDGNVSLLNTLRHFIRGMTGPEESVLFRAVQTEVLCNEIYPSGFSYIGAEIREDLAKGHQTVIQENVQWHLRNNSGNESCASLLVALASLWNAGNSAFAYDLCKEACKVWPNHSSAPFIGLYRITANLARTAGETDEALGILERIILHCNDPITVCLFVQDLGDAYWGMGKLEDARREFKRSLEIVESQDSKSPESERIRSRAYEQLGNLSRVEGNPQLSLDYVQKARTILDQSKMKGSGLVWIKAWMYLQEANALYDLGQKSDRNFSACWHFLFLAARDFHSHLDDASLAGIAERALRIFVDDENGVLVRKCYSLAKTLRDVSESSAQKVDRDEYLDDTNAIAERKYFAVRDSILITSRSEIREELVALLRSQYDRT